MDYDLVLENGRVIDPESGTDGILSVGIKEGIIKDICTEKLAGEKLIDASGCVVAPGFIDIHAHEDFMQDSSLAEDVPYQTALVLLRSGVTTMVGGNCGFLVYPLAPFLEKCRNNPLPLNYIALVGYNSLRGRLGLGRYSSPGAGDIDYLKEWVREGMELGFPGISLGLQYDPGITSEEILEAARIVREYDRFMAVHMRYDYPSRAQETVREMLEIAKATGVRLQLSHLAANVYGGDNMKITLEEIKHINERGYDVKGDMYPYDTWATGIKSAVFDGEPFRIYNFTYGDVEVLTGPWAGERCTPELFAKLREETEDTVVSCHNATPWPEIEQALQSPFVFLGSDAVICQDAATGEIKGHPRSGGTTVKFLRHFVRDKKLLDLKTALAKMTLDPANRLKMHSKGRLQQGKDADITVFRLDRLMEKGEYGVNVCALPPVGIKYVIVGGKIAYTEEDGQRFTREIADRRAVPCKTLK